jgi:hypothetical protein
MFRQYQPVISTFVEFSSHSEFSSASLPLLLLSPESSPSVWWPHLHHLRKRIPVVQCPFLASPILLTKGIKGQKNKKDQNRRFRKSAKANIFF